MFPSNPSEGNSGAVDITNWRGGGGEAASHPRLNVRGRSVKGEIYVATVRKSTIPTAGELCALAIVKQ